MKDSLLKLQNGTDIRGVVIENDRREITMQDSDIRAIARGILCWLEGKNRTKSSRLRIAVGMDSRLSGEHIKGLLIEEFINQGVQILDCGLATTPSMFMTTIWEDYRCHCGIMITASHLSYFYNGMKIFTPQGGTQKDDIEDILRHAAELYEKTEEEVAGGTVRQADILSDYSGMLAKLIIQETGMSKPFEGMKIIVDAGNGAGGFFANRVLATLGADIRGSQFLEPDGMFPNHEPNPENKEAMRAISEAVLSHKADLGIIFDTDVDRAAIVTDDGMEINRNSLIAMIAAIVLREHPGSVIVTDSITSDGLTEFIEKRGGAHQRFKRGYKNVINESKRINEEEERKSYLAIETSGHAALEENYFLDDGTYLVAKLLVEASGLHQNGKKLQELIADLKQPYESLEMRVKIKKENFKAYGEMVLENFERFACGEGWRIVSPNYEGVKASFDGGWILVRMSLHEPVLPVNIETDREGAAEQVVRRLSDFIRGYEGLEC